MGKMTPGATLANIKGWSFTVNGVENRYKMTEKEAKAIMPVLERNQKKAAVRYTDRSGCACPSCGNDVSNVDVFCRWCGQRLEKED